MQIENLTKELLKANELNEKLTEENERLKNQNNKNSNNSSKPSYTNMIIPKNKTRANMYNYRIKSQKKCGGQFGHKGHNLSKKEVEDLIESKKLEVRTITHSIKGKNELEKFNRHVRKLIGNKFKIINTTNE